MMMEQMDKDLGLTKDQAAKMKVVHEKHQETAKALSAKMADDAKRLKKLVADKATDPVLAAATSEVIADHRLMMEAQMTHQDEMQTVLTKSQYATVLVDLCEKMHDGKMGMGMGMGKGMMDKDEDEDKEEKEYKTKK
jgi:Spy/CpxP family protein refolding chaperone